MYCTRCGTNNAKTSKFCRECGRKLEAGIPESETWRDDKEKSPAEQAVETAKLGDILFQAFQDVEAGKLDQALTLCQEALRLNSESTAGHSLLAMVFEKRGDLNAALRHYDRVVALNPRSVADREKRDDLRHRLREAEAEPSIFQTVWKGYLEKAGPFLESKRPWPQAIGAFLLTFLVLMMFWPKSPSQPQVSQQPNQTPMGQPSQTPPAENYSQQPAPSGRDLPFAGGGTEQQPPESTYTPPPSNAPAQAVSPSAPPRKTVTRTVPQPTPRLYLPPISVEARPRAEAVRPAPTPAPVRPPTNSGTVTISRSNPPARPAQEDPATKARRLQLSGDYDGAITAYRQALGGNNQGQVYQQIATCYQRLGRSKDAVTNYQSAIKSYDQQIASGNNAEDAQRGKRSSELGLKVSQQAGG
jgi:tetratricopeptide (TPR) repeat protein